MKKAILFDLDGTLLQMEQKLFEKEYFTKLTQLAVKHGYNADKFKEVLLKSVNAMYKNNGEQTNEQVFWNVFKQGLGEDVTKLEPVFYNFYFNEYNQIKSIVNTTENIKQIVDFAKQNFKYVILATNPLFPIFGVDNRLGWINFNINDFSYVTSYENSHYSKPNPNYYLEILNKFNLKPEECIMVGNNELEDYVITSSLGMSAVLVGNHVIPYNETSKVKPYSFNELPQVLLQLKNK